MRGFLPSTYFPDMVVVCVLLSVWSLVTFVTSRSCSGDFDQHLKYLSCRWIESICGQYLSHIYGKRQARDISRTLEIFKTVAASETNINYTVLMMLRCKTLTEAMPKVMFCSMIDPIHIHEIPRMVYNFILNSISLPIFYAVSVFQREMEIPTLPLETVVEFFTNGTYCACCIKSGRQHDPSTQCTLREVCHTKRIKDMLVRALDRRAFLPKDSGMLMRYDTNSIPYITAYGGEDDRCDMSLHDLFGRVRNTSCMRGKYGKKTAGGASGRGGGGGQSSFAGGGGGRDNDGDDDDGGEGGGGGRNNGAASESVITDEACRMFSKQCFQFYAKPFCDCAMITEGEFCNSVEEFSRMTTKFAQFFGDLPFFGKHSTVMKNLGIPNVPRCFNDLTNKQVFEQGQPIIRAKSYMSGEVALGIDWMCMLLLLSISGSSRIDQQLGKNVAMNLVAELFNKIPYTMFPYDAVQVREFNPHMPCQEIVQLRPPAARFGCVVRPNNKCVLDDSVPIQERVLVPSCPLAPGLMMEDIGMASPLYDLCSLLGIASIYNLPIELVPWPIPYPIGIPWPVTRYGSPPVGGAEEGVDREMGYIVVAPGGKTRLWIYPRGSGEICCMPQPILLGNVSEVASAHKMGPRPLFCTPCRGVKVSDSRIGVLVPFEEEEGGEEEVENVSQAAYHPGMSPETYSTHPLRRLYDAKTDSYQYWCPDSQTRVTVRHSWVEKSVLPICSQILVKGWSPCMEKLAKHIAHRRAAGSSRPAVSSEEGSLQKEMKRNMVFVMGKIVPPRGCNEYDVGVWVSIEVRHTVGNLKNMPYADMITLKVPPGDLRPMVNSKDYVVEACGTSTSKYTLTRSVGQGKRKADRNTRIPSKRVGNRGSDKERSGKDSGDGNIEGDDEDEEEDEGTIIISRFIYASRVAER